MIADRLGGDVGIWTVGEDLFEFVGAGHAKVCERELDLTGDLVRTGI